MSELLEVAYKKNFLKRNNLLVKRLLQQKKKEDKTIGIMKMEVTKLFINILESKR